MPELEWLLSVTGITFPVFFLAPTLAVAFRLYIVPPGQMSRFFTLALADYSLVVGSVGYSLWKAGAQSTLVVFIGAVVLISPALFLIRRWVIRENGFRYLDAIIRQMTG